MRINASLGSKTDTLPYNGNSLTLTVYSLASQPGLRALKATALAAHKLPIRGEVGKNFWLDCCRGVENRVANHVMNSKWALR
jgi:hypothetical protein